MNGKKHRKNTCLSMKYTAPTKVIIRAQ